MREDVIKYVNSCPVCQTIKFKFKSRRDEMFLPVHSQVPFDTLHLAFGQTAKKSDRNKTTKSFLVVIDEFTKYCDAQAMREDSESIIKFLEKHPSVSKARTIISHNGKSFDSA
jgi:hypothetical protein